MARRGTSRLSKITEKDIIDNEGMVCSFIYNEQGIVDTGFINNVKFDNLTINQSDIDTKTSEEGHAVDGKDVATVDALSNLSILREKDITVEENKEEETDQNTPTIVTLDTV